MGTIIRKENEELFFPNGFWCAYAYIVSILFLIICLYFLYIFIDELINANYGSDYFIKFALVLFFGFFTPILDVFKSKRIYVNFFEKYFRIRNKIIPFDDIVYIKYNYGYLKPFKYSIYSTVFYFVLRNGEKVRFLTFFRGSDNVLKRELKDLEFSVQKCGFRDL
ncbi:hypothetical protein IKE67_07375 [bacterium]|nr:hypothetical protein [bacterium]